MKHLKDVNENYFTHLKHATHVGLLMVIGGILCLVHGIFPFLFTHTASKMLFEIDLINKARELIRENK